MMDTTHYFTLLALLILTPQGLSKGYYKDPKDYDYTEYYYYPELGADPPSFLARPQMFTVEVGQSVIIPCDVENSVGKNKLIIKKLPANGASEKLLSVGNDKVTPDPRMTVDGTRLTISHTRPRDAGTFICQFDLEPPLQLRHTLDVQYAPTVRALVPPEQRVAKGNSVSLECKAHGNPEPIIRWSRQEGPLPSGHRSQQGEMLTLEAVDRHMEGTYLCTADNGIGEPASAAVSLTVEYPPEITTEQGIVRTGEGDTVELVCVVHGRPPPDVMWTLDGRKLPDTIMDTKLHQPQQPSHTHTTHDTHLSQTHFAHRHTLTINNVKEKDFGTYVCIAENPHGQKTAVIQMTSLPKPPQLTSSPNGGESTKYTLTWETESYYPITEFLIKYRKSHLGAWQRNHDMVMADSWESVSRTVEPNSRATQGPRHALAYTLDALEVATDYVAVVRVRNKYGWSAESDNFSFSTKKAMAVQQSTSGARGQMNAAPLLMLLMVSLVFTMMQGSTSSHYLLGERFPATLAVSQSRQ
ncbi:protein amalgam-like isoform X3 [Homarus americanus]|uniref:protein amalgam-like isoform X3 n=1 Tax=Homarus americanus TaxID=6706 RepID=UPI001C43E45B|nr:protein amalgam-like isoform X3 [Homarus americanus]